MLILRFLVFPTDKLSPADAAVMETFVVPRYLSFYGELVLELLIAGEGARIAHIGCRTGYPDRQLFELSSGAPIVGVDSSPAALELARNKAATVGEAAIEYYESESLPTELTAGAFSHALCLHPAGGTDSRRALYREMYRLLVTGGQALVSLPLRGSFQEVGDLFREYALKNDDGDFGKIVEETMAARHTIETLSEEMEDEGFDDVDVEIRTTTLSFDSGRSFVEDPVSRLLVLPERPLVPRRCGPRPAAFVRAGRDRQVLVRRQIRADAERGVRQRPATGLAPVKKLALTLAFVALGCSERAPRAKATLWPEADTLFHTDPRWIGGDGAYSVDLGNDRVLWLFGDSFIARTADGVRDESRMVRNSVAIQTGRDPSNAFMQFYWPELDGEAQSFVKEEGTDWYWPMHGILLGDKLLLFFERLNSPSGDPTGFESNAWRALLVDNPDADPANWMISGALAPGTTHEVLVGEAAIAEGKYLYLYGTRGASHAIFVARTAISEAEQGRIDALAWWTGSDWSTSGDPEAIVNIGAPEFSVHHDSLLGKYVMVHTEGYGATTLAWRVAESPQGPWSDPGDLLRPPESFEPDAFVYAGKGHPELDGADLVATYVPSSFEDRPLSDEARLYYPHFVRVSYR